MSVVVKPLVSVLSKWLVIRSNVAVYVHRELRAKVPASPANTVGVRL